mgnify:CR=1 FL=1
MVSHETGKVIYEHINLLPDKTWIVQKLVNFNARLIRNWKKPLYEKYFAKVLKYLSNFLINNMLTLNFQPKRFNKEPQVNF